MDGRGCGLELVLAADSSQNAAEAIRWHYRVGGNDQHGQSEVCEKGVDAATKQALQAPQAA